jgi:hypothetical protein
VKEGLNMAYVSETTKKYFLSLKPEELGIKMQTHLFGRTADPKTKKINPPRYIVTDRVKLKAKEYINLTDVDTTLGRLVFNKICIEPYIKDVVPNHYWNKVMDKGGVKALYNCVSEALKYGKITTEVAWKWEKAIEFYSLKGAIIYNSSYNADLLIPREDLIKERDEFIKNNPNATTADFANFEEKITGEASKKLADNPGVGLYNSGARGEISDQYKNISIMIGPVYNPATAQMEPVTSNFIEGFKKEDIPKAGNMLISAAYPKSCATADTGYITKQYYAAFQSVYADEDGTDCGTKSYLNVPITEKNFNMYEFQYVMENGKPVMLSQENKKKYIGKTVKLRSPMCCLGEHVCSICAGRFPYIANIKNIGITFATIPNAALNGGMKKFHKSAIKMDDVDVDSLII